MSAELRYLDGRTFVGINYFCNHSGILSIETYKSMKEEVRQKVMERFSISEQAMRLLLESAEMMSFVPKDIIVHEGEINTNMYILSKGIWRAYTFKDGTEDTFWFAVESEIALPVWGYTSGSPSLYTIEAVTESEAYCLSKQKLEILFNPPCN